MRLGSRDSLTSPGGSPRLLEMRILTLLAAVWGLVGMPALCRAGVLVDCCAPTHHPEEAAPGCPEACPKGCPGESPDQDADGTGSSDQRDCSSCADICKSVSWAPKKTAGVDFANTVTPVVATTATLATGPPSAPYISLGVSHGWPYQDLPFPISDRPLLL
jgi:hypothetical protein